MKHIYAVEKVEVVRYQCECGKEWQIEEGPKYIPLICPFCGNKQFCVEVESEEHVEDVARTFGFLPPEAPLPSPDKGG